MRRFTLASPVLTVLLFVFVSTTTTHAAQRVARIGVLCVTSCTMGTMTAFWDELRQARMGGGCQHRRRAQGGICTHRPTLGVAAELAQSKPDLIVADLRRRHAPPRMRLRRYRSCSRRLAIPSVWGLRRVLPIRIGNVTGAATFAPGDFNGKTFGIVREVLPQAKRVTAFINSANETHRLLYMKEAPSAADKLGFQLDTVDLHNPEELPGAVAAAKARGAEALYVVSDPIFLFPPNRVPDLVAQAGVTVDLTSAHFCAIGGPNVIRTGFPCRGSTWSSLC